MFELTAADALQYLTIPAFNKTGITAHAFTTRTGGVSPVPYASLNLGLNTGDSEINVRENRRQVCAALGIDPGWLTAGRQVHGDRIAVVTIRERGKGAFTLDDCFPDTDALITADREVALTGFFADCAPVFLLDPVRQCIGLAHAGWRGALQKIAVKTALKMQAQFHSAPADLLVGIGPAIGPCCFEVGPPVIETLRQAFPDYQDVYWPTGPDKWKLDLCEINRRQLVELGVPPEQISVSRLCTRCRTDLFFSYRAENGTTGRMGAILMLR